MCVVPREQSVQSTGFVEYKAALFRSIVGCQKLHADSDASDGDGAACGTRKVIS